MTLLPDTVGAPSSTELVHRPCTDRHAAVEHRRARVCAPGASREVQRRPPTAVDVVRKHRIHRRAACEECHHNHGPASRMASMSPVKPPSSASPAGASVAINVVNMPAAAATRSAAPRSATMPVSPPAAVWARHIQRRRQPPSPPGGRAPPPPRRPHPRSSRRSRLKRARAGRAATLARSTHRAGGAGASSLRTQWFVVHSGGGETPPT